MLDQSMGDLANGAMAFVKDNFTAVLFLQMVGASLIIVGSVRWLIKNPTRPDPDPHADTEFSENGVPKRRD